MVVSSSSEGAEACDSVAVSGTEAVIPSNRAVCVETNYNGCHVIFARNLPLEDAVMINPLQLVSSQLISRWPEPAIIESVLYAVGWEEVWFIRVDMVDDFGISVYFCSDQPQDAFTILIDKCIKVRRIGFQHRRLRHTTDDRLHTSNIFNPATISQELSRLHDRMPVILPAEMIDDWIRPDSNPAELVKDALTDMVFERAI